MLYFKIRLTSKSAKICWKSDKRTFRGDEFSHCLLWYCWPSSEFHWKACNHYLCYATIPELQIFKLRSNFKTLNFEKHFHLQRFKNTILGNKIHIILVDLLHKFRLYIEKPFHRHCVKSVRTRSVSGLYLPACGLNTEKYSVSHRIQSECGKIWNRKTPNADTFYKVKCSMKKLF